MAPGRALAVICFAAAGGILSFWMLYFTGTAPLGQADPLRRAFEAAFPLADGVLASLLLAAGIAAWRRRSIAFFLLAAAGAQSVYLGLIDGTFNWRHGLYGTLTSESLSAAAINLACILGGIAALVHAARRWRVAEAA